MFTGIVQGMGVVSAVEKTGQGIAIEIEGGVLEGADIGASVAVNGTCLTVVGRTGPRARFDVSEETIERTTTGGLQTGEEVNLERPLRAGDELGGHIVQGHVDAVGVVSSVTSDERGSRVRVRLPVDLDAFLVEKGSITLDGVSLTIAALDGSEVEVALIPHTLAVTTFGSAAPGRRVNVEVDVISKYVERLVAPYLRSR